MKLERIPTEILLLLTEKNGELVTRDQIIERVWGEGVFLDTDNSINGAIRKIRQVLEDDPTACALRGSQQKTSSAVPPQKFPQLLGAAMAVEIFFKISTPEGLQGVSAQNADQAAPSL